MIISFKSHLFKPLIVSFIPLLLSTTLYTFQIVLRSIPGFANTSKAPFESENNIFSFFTTTPNPGFGIYSSNFSEFIFIMMILHFIVTVFSFAKKLLVTIANEYPRSLLHPLPLSFKTTLKQAIFHNTLKNFMISFIISSICYSLVFCSSQILGGLILNFLPQVKRESALLTSFQDITHQSPLHPDYPGQNMRILEETSVIPPTKSPVPVPRTEKLSLSMVKIAGNLDIDVSSVILSKDNKLAFAIIDYYGTLKIIDISDPHDPIVKASLNLIRTEKNYQFKALTLSQDEKTLYACNFQYLEVISLKNPANPTLLGKIKNPKLPDVTQSVDFPRDFRTTIEVSADSNYIIAGGLGLQIFEVSNPQTPLLVRSDLNNFSNKDTLVTGICLSKDRKTLFFANKTLTVYNISNPTEMQLISSLGTSYRASSVLLSNDAKTIFAIGQSDNGNNIQIEQINITTLARVDTFVTGEYSFFAPALLAISPGNTQVYVFTSFAKATGFLVFDIPFTAAQLGLLCLLMRPSNSMIILIYVMKNLKTLRVKFEPLGPENFLREQKI